jgi:hypothetical protein
MIKFFANAFRGVHFMLGITAPPPGENERQFVFVWLSVILFFLLFFASLIYFVPRLYLKS